MNTSRIPVTVFRHRATRRFEAFEIDAGGVNIIDETIALLQLGWEIAKSSSVSFGILCSGWCVTSARSLAAPGGSSRRRTRRAECTAVRRVPHGSSPVQLQRRGFHASASSIRPFHAEGHRPKVSQLSPLLLGARSKDALHQWCFVSVLVISLSKVFSHRANGTRIDLRVVQQWLRNIRDHGVVRLRTRHTPQTAPEETKASSVDAAIPVNNQDDENAPLAVDWGAQCRALATENAALRDQLHQLQREDSPSSSPAFQTLQETVDYWKRVAQMNAQQTDSEVQAERRHGARQLEQLKADMVQLVEEERAALLKEFQSMVEQLQESLLVVVEDQ
jgi:hypothetical protein